MTDSASSPTTLVLGATGGIGSALCGQLTDAGHQVIAAGRDEERLRAIEERTSCSSVQISDVREAGAIEACVEAASAMSERLTGVAYCIGSMILKPAHRTSDEEWRDALTVNLTSAFALCRAAVSRMREGGSIVYVTTAAARVGLPNHEAIASAKAGVEGLVRSAAATYASRGLRFNAVAPGLVRTELTRNVWDNDAASNASLAMHAVGRFGEPGDIASIMTWLLDPQNDWATGQVFSVDGGLSSVRGKMRV